MSATNVAREDVAREAFEAFHRGDHGKCGDLLETISGQKGITEIKVQHNKALNEYYKSDCADPQALLTLLAQAHDRSREREKKDKSKKKKEEDEEEGGREDEDVAVLRYNQALLCLQLRQHAQALMILEELFEGIEPIDDYLAIKICFLLLELYLIQREPESACSVLAYLEKPAAFNTVMPSQRPAVKADNPSLLGEAESGDSKADKSPESQPEHAPKSPPPASPTAKSEPEPPKGPKPPEGPLPSLTVGSFLAQHGRAPDAISRAEYKFFCLMYRARVSVALKNTKAAKKEVKNANELLEELRHEPILTVSSKTGEHGNGNSASTDPLRESIHNQHLAMYSMMKAYLDCTRLNLNAKRAMRVMATCPFNFADTRHASYGRAEDASAKQRRKSTEEEDDPNPTDCHPALDEACSPIFFNNVGIVHVMMHKPRLAAFYFQKALSAMRPSSQPMGIKAPGVTVTRHWLDRRAEVAYNAGLQMLMCEQPAAALRCFEQCVPVFRTWPRLWLRMAESHIALHRQSGGATDGDMTGNAQHKCRGALGSGLSRRWLLPTTATQPLGQNGGGGGEEDAVQGDDSHESERHPLVQAAMCLRNMLASVAPLLPERNSQGADADACAIVSGGSAAPAGASPVEKTASASRAAGKAAPAAPAAPAAQSPPAASPKAGSSSGSSRHQARDLQESEASLLEDAALVKFAYVCLLQLDYSGALRHCRRLLEKNALLPQTGTGRVGVVEEVEERKSWAFQAQNLPQVTQAAGSTQPTFAPAKFPSSAVSITLAVNYAAEALLALGRAAETRTLLGLFVNSKATVHCLDAMDLKGIEQHVVRAGPETESHVEDTKDTQKICAGRSPTRSMGGLTPAAYVQQSMGSGAKEGKEMEKEKSNAKESSQAAMIAYPATHFASLGATHCMLYANLAAMYAQNGNMDEAEAACEKALKIQPGAVAPLRTLVYALLSKGNHAQALKRLKQARS